MTSEKFSVSKFRKVYIVLYFIFLNLSIVLSETMLR